MKAQINIDTRGLYHFINEKLVLDWIESVIMYHGYFVSEVNYTFYKDDELLEINNQFLNHDFYTDIITFDNSIGQTISADIAVSIDRVKDNAHIAKESYHDEVLRVMVHGVLHCIGFNDKSDAEKEQMRKEENKMLNMFHVEQTNLEDNV